MKTSKLLRLFLTFVALVLPTLLSAQGTETLKSKLSQSDPVTGARIEVTEYGDAGEIIRSVRTSGTDRKVNGYRVRIFFDNSQNARQYASATIGRFKELFAETPAYMIYENPYWKVTVGNCLTMEEAIILKGRIQGSFDKAFVVREEIPLSVFTE